MNTPIYIPMTVATDAHAISMSAATNGETLNMNTAVTISASGFPEYDGPVEVTPTRETQILSTSGTLVQQDITVKPIPPNYGLITWNGAILTVS